MSLKNRTERAPGIAGCGPHVYMLRKACLYRVVRALPRSNFSYRWLVRCALDPADLRLSGWDWELAPPVCMLQVTSTNHIGVQAELGARESSGSNLPRPLICLSGVKSLPRGPAIIDFPGTHQNVSVGGLKTRSMWQTSQARAASSSHQKPCASDFLFYSSCPPPIYSRLLLPSLRDPVEMSSNV